MKCHLAQGVEGGNARVWQSGGLNVLGFCFAVFSHCLKEHPQVAPYTGHAWQQLHNLPIILDCI